jgi:hypothetical protein
MLLESSKALLVLALAYDRELLCLFVGVLVENI